MGLTVAIVGRPNVGKSTLFNRLVGKRLALVDDTPGVTRDRREGEGQLFDLSFTVIDTAGFEDDAQEASLQGRMRRQTEQAAAQADLALLVIDARAGLTPADEFFAALLRRGRTPVVVVANKCESKAGDGGWLDAFALGFGEPVSLSAEHGLGLSDLYDAIREALASEGGLSAAEALGDEAAAPQEVIQLTIVGRPNVGKSTLVNRLVGEERLLTGPEAGITRDAIAVEWRYRDRRIRLVDTAGLRKRARIEEKLERLSTVDAFRAIQFAQVAVLLIDATAGLERQDLTIASRVLDEGRALVIGVNKWDLCEDREAAIRKLRDRLARSLPQTPGLPVVTLSALQGANCDRLIDAVLEIYEVWNRRLPTAELNRWLEEILLAHPPPMVAGRRNRIKYVTQAKTRPPTFALFCSKPQGLPRSYERYLENALRKHFDLPGTPIRLLIRKGKNPYAQ